jgi:hypothetical protein
MIQPLTRRGNHAAPGAFAPQARRPSAAQPTQPAHGCRRFDPVAHSLKLPRDDGAGVADRYPPASERHRRVKLHPDGRVARREC